MARYKLGENDPSLQEGAISISNDNKELNIRYRDVITGEKHQVYLCDDQVNYLYEILKNHLEK